VKNPSPPILNRIPPLKGQLPFRLGTTSFILPDFILPNVQFLAPYVDDIELLLFEADSPGDLPGTEELRQLSALATENDLSYTVHLPLVKHLGSSNESLRQASVDTIRQAATRTQLLEPEAWILHIEGETPGPQPAPDLSAWLHAVNRSLRDLLASGIPSERLCIENLAYPLQLLSNLLSEHKVSVCLDIGHLLLYDYGVDANLDTYHSQTKVVHLHALKDQRDHCHLGFFDAEKLGALVRRFATTPSPRVVTLELFRLQDWALSMEVFARYV
jgi:sugar phosphate isomerase/epimerase